MDVQVGAIVSGDRGRRRKRARSWHSRPLSVPSLERGTLADRAADEIRARIQHGAVTPGQRIESLRELAAELGISMSVVREAVSRLKGEGHLEVRHGVGIFVARRITAARTLKAARLRAARRDISELRTVVDPAIARAAASRAGSRTVEDLHFALAQRSSARLGPDPRLFTQADLAFHLAVARVSRNGIGIGIHRMGARVLQPALAARALELARNRELDELHDALFYAIDAGQARRAEQLARRIAAIEAVPP